MTTNVLVVCTGNICRSPMAEAMWRVGASVVGLDMRVASGGSWEAGHQADPHAISVLQDRGIDLERHRSRLVAPADLEAAHLVVAMAREHVVRMSAMVPAAFEKTLTLKELETLARDAGPRDTATQTISDYVAALDSERSHAQFLGAPPSFDIEDPLGQSRRAFEKTATELEGLIWTTLDLLAGYPPRT